MQPSRKRVQNNVSKDDPGFQEKNGEDAKNIYQRPKRTKEQNSRRTIHWKESKAEQLRQNGEVTWKTKWWK